MLIVEYNAKDGTVFPDALTLKAVKDDYQAAWCQAGADYTRTVASELYITALRVLVARGEIDHRLVKIIYIRDGVSNFDIVISVDKFGQLSEWPEGFCDTDEKFLTEIITTQSEIREKDYG